MKKAEIRIIDAFIKTGRPVYRVTKDSRIPAAIKIGISPITIFNPFFAPCLNESRRVNVPGNMILLAITRPAAPARTIADISRVPWIQIVRNESRKRPCS